MSEIIGSDGMPPIPEIELGRTILLSIAVRQVVGFTLERTADSQPTVVVPTQWDFPENTSHESPVVIISPGLLQTHDDVESHPFLHALKNSLLQAGCIVIRYADAGAQGESDPAFKAYSLRQFAENLHAVADAARQQTWYRSRKLVFIGFSAGCHSVLNEMSNAYRSSLIQPDFAILISPLAKLTADVRRYLDRDRALKRKPGREFVSYLYFSRQRNRVVALPADFFEDSEMLGTTQLPDALQIPTRNPLLIIRPLDDKFSGIYTLDKQQNVISILLIHANHDMIDGDQPDIEALNGLLRHLRDNKLLEV